MQVKIKNLSTNPLPSYQTQNAAGVDLFAFLHKEIILKPLERIVVPTGIFIELPQGTEAQIRPRSGLAAKFGITVLNTPGTIDSDYRGEIKVILINLSQENFTITNGQRIAQMIFANFIQPNFKLVENLSNTQRGSGGFGHTGF